VIQVQRICSAAVIILCLSFVGPAALAAEPKRVMLLHSFGREFRPWSEYAKTIRIELNRQSPWPLDIHDHSVISARFSDPNAELAFVEYLRTLYSERPLDLIFCIGAPAADFVQRHREQLFPITPMLYTAVEQRRVRYSSLTENDAVVALVHDFAAVFENILRVLPDIKTVAVVNGKSSAEQFWEGELRREAKPFENRITFKWYSELSFKDILKDAAALPPRSAILWESMSVDAAGVVYEGDTALTSLHSVANAPIFTYLAGPAGRLLAVRCTRWSREVGRLSQSLFVFSGAKRRPTSRHLPSDLQRRSSTGGKCSAGGLASQVCHPAARFGSAI